MDKHVDLTVRQEIPQALDHLGYEQEAKILRSFMPVTDGYSAKGAHHLLLIYCKGFDRVLEVLHESRQISRDDRISIDRASRAVLVIQFRIKAALAMLGQAIKGKPVLN